MNNHAGSWSGCDPPACMRAVQLISTARVMLGTANTSLGQRPHETVVANAPGLMISRRMPSAFRVSLWRSVPPAARKANLSISEEVESAVESLWSINVRSPGAKLTRSGLEVSWFDITPVVSVVIEPHRRSRMLCYNTLCANCGHGADSVLMSWDHVVYRGLLHNRRNACRS